MKFKVPVGKSSSATLTWLEEKVVLLFSTKFLRAVSIVAVLSAAACIAAALYFSIPAAKPKEPPMPPPPAWPAKSQVTMADFAPHAPASASPQEAKPLPERAAMKKGAALDPDSAALEAELKKFRDLAKRLDYPWDDVWGRVCTNFFFGNCYSWENRITKTGLKHHIANLVYRGIDEPKLQLALLKRAEDLFSAVASQGQTKASLWSLAGPAGLRSFDFYFLQPAAALRSGYHDLFQQTPSNIPRDVMVSLVGDVYPGVIALLSGSKASPDEKVKMVRSYIDILVYKEVKRYEDMAKIASDYETRLNERQMQIGVENAAYETKQAAKSSARVVSLEGFAVGIALIVAMGLLLALMAIERHLRRIVNEIGQMGRQPAEGGADKPIVA